MPEYLGTELSLPPCSVCSVAGCFAPESWLRECFQVPSRCRACPGSAPLLSFPFSWLLCIGLVPHGHGVCFKDLSCTNLKARKRHEPSADFPRIGSQALCFLKQLFDENKEPLLLFPAEKLKPIFREVCTVLLIVQGNKICK